MTITVHSPEPGFSGEVAGVVFARGSATVDPAAPTATAALAYFRRRGYSMSDEEYLPEPVAPDDGQEPDGDEPVPFDPTAHTVAEVLAYLSSSDEDERARVLAAEEAGEARATILKKGPSQ